MRRGQHVEEHTAERTLKACLCKTRVPVACLLTFAAQQSTLQMRMQTIRVIYGGCVRATPL